MTNTVKQQILAIRQPARPTCSTSTGYSTSQTAKGYYELVVYLKTTAKSTPTLSSRGKSAKYADFYTSDLLSERVE